jgi:hypothetical protein
VNDEEELALEAEDDALAEPPQLDHPADPPAPTAAARRCAARTGS